jgi:hypothetical protein
MTVLTAKFTFKREQLLWEKELLIDPSLKQVAVTLGLRVSIMESYIGFSFSCVGIIQ